jgi:hypothetical protein
MQVICPDCQTPFQFPAEHIPHGKEIWVICPKCHGARALSHMAPPPAPVMSPGAKAASGPPRLGSAREEVGAALVCMADASSRMRIEQALSNLNYVLNRAPTLQEALGSLQTNDYQVVIVEETRAGDGGKENLLLRYLQMLPMRARRQIFFCVVSETEATLDELAAFRFCANLVINAQDLDLAEGLLWEARADYDSFYKVIRQEQDRLSQV